MTSTFDPCPPFFRGSAINALRRQKKKKPLIELIDRLREEE
jgi:hypothetical protein